MDAFSLWTFVIAVVGCAGGIVATIIAIRAERRATKAEQALASAQERKVWTDLISATQPLLGVNVGSHDMQPMLANFRSATTELLDDPSARGYRHLDEWLRNENKMMLGLFELAKSRLPGNMMTNEQWAQAHDPVNFWIESFINNLRVARNGWTESDVDREFEKLAKTAAEQYAELKRQNPGLIPADPRDQG